MKKYLAILLVLGAAISASAQKSSVEALNRKINAAESAIAKNDSLLRSTRKDKASGARELKLIQNRITSRRKVVSALEDQIGILNEDFIKSQKTVANLSVEQEKLKAEYAEMVREAYKNKLTNNYLEFIFSSKNFEDVTRRINYLRRYNNMQKTKTEEIDSLSGIISTHMSELDVKMTGLDNTKSSYKSELNKLGNDENEYKSTLNKLTKTENNLSKDNATQRRQIQNAQGEIARIIAQENKKTKKIPLNDQQQREVKALSGRFDQNKGKLPYPVRTGVIIDHYNAKTLPGVNIAAGKGAQVRSVFEGVVSQIFFLQGLNNCVMVRHGNYITVYSNLASVAVKKGDKVALNQLLGAISDSDDTSKHSVHFEMWQEMTNLNPEIWLIN